MKPLALFQKTSPIKSSNALFIANRMQILYFIFIFPEYISYSYMIWIILALGIFSQLNLILLSKWLSSDYAAKGYRGYVQLFGERKFRFLVLLATLPILTKIAVLTLNYVEIVRQYIFPSINSSWLILFIILISFYVASKGMENTIRFSVIAFLASFWMNLLFIPSFFPPLASMYNLFPLIPVWSDHTWKGIFFIWASLSGPEYLICLIPWMKQDGKMLKYLSWSNTISVLQYLMAFIAAILFFGSRYLEKTEFPIIELVRYLQNPIFERSDILLISIYLFHFIFTTSILLLCFYGAIRIIFNRVNKDTTRIGFISASFIIFAFIFVLNIIFEKNETQLNFWLLLDVFFGGLLYLLLPSCLLILGKIKGRMKV